MPALMIINYNVTDAERLDAYREGAIAALVGPDKGTVVAVSNDTADLGEGAPSGTTTVILQFASVEAAQAIYDSDPYQDVLGERLAATAPKFAIIVATTES